MTPTSCPPPRHRVVVIGSGFGGLSATKALHRSAVDITMIDKTSHHLFQPLLYQVATGILAEGEIAPSTRMILKRQKNASVILGEVTDIDLVSQTVTSRFADNLTTTRFDSLIVAAGAQQSYFGNDHFARYAPGMKTIDDALELRGRILSAFEEAEVCDSEQRRARLLTFVVVGAGPTGVEMAGQIAELAHHTLVGAYSRIDTRTVRIVLIDGAPAVLPQFDEKLSRHAANALNELGVEVRLGCMVSDVDADGITVLDADGQEQRVESICKVWSAGVRASELGELLAEQSGATLDRAGRVAVNDDLTLPGFPNVYVVGDMISLDGLPGVAQVAIQGAHHAARSIATKVAARSRSTTAPAPQPFVYKDKGAMATIARCDAVASIGRLRLTGVAAWALWLAVHVVYIVGFKNRLTTLMTWAWTFGGAGRGQLTNTYQQAHGRNAMTELHRLRQAKRANDFDENPLVG